MNINRLKPLDNNDREEIKQIQDIIKEEADRYLKSHELFEMTIQPEGSLLATQQIEEHNNRKQIIANLLTEPNLENKATEILNSMQYNIAIGAIGKNLYDKLFNLGPTVTNKKYEDGVLKPTITKATTMIPNENHLLVEHQLESQFNDINFLNNIFKYSIANHEINRKNYMNKYVNLNATNNISKNFNEDSSIYNNTSKLTQFKHLVGRLNKNTVSEILAFLPLTTAIAIELFTDKNVNIKDIMKSIDNANKELSEVNESAKEIFQSFSIDKMTQDVKDIGNDIIKEVKSDIKHIGEKIDASIEKEVQKKQQQEGNTISDNQIPPKANLIDKILGVRNAVFNPEQVNGNTVEENKTNKLK